jgi:trk system potassium uptake protein TrkH
MLAPWLVALEAGESGAGAYLFSACLTAGCGGAAFLASKERRGGDFRSALLLVVLWWAGAPMFAGLPLALGGLSFADAYFEAVSALTTTGAWLSEFGAYGSRSGLFWRAALQWIGGLASLAIAAAIFIRPAFIGVDTLLPPFSRGERGSDLHAIRSAVAAFLAPYVLITFACAVAQMAAGAVLFDAIVNAFSTVASGGLFSTDGQRAAPSAAMAAALFPFLILSGANFVILARLARGSLRGARDVETGVYIMMALLVGVLFWALAGADDPALLPHQLFNAASLLATNGVLIGEQPGFAVALITAIIGGAAVSTAGGFKVLRWLVIVRRAREEIRRLVTPSGVFGLSRVANELGVWMHFLVFTLTLAALMLAVAASGHSFEVAAATATAMLSNTGPLLDLAVSEGVGYALFSGPLQGVLIVGMILGRLEAVAALALINRAFWRS